MVTECEVCGNPIPPDFCTKNVCPKCCEEGKCPDNDLCAYKAMEAIEELENIEP